MKVNLDELERRLKRRTILNIVGIASATILAMNVPLYFVFRDAAWRHGAAQLGLAIAGALGLVATLIYARKTR